VHIGIKGAKPYHFPKIHHNLLDMSPDVIKICKHYTEASVFKAMSKKKIINLTQMSKL